MKTLKAKTLHPKKQILKISDLTYNQHYHKYNVKLDQGVDKITNIMELKSQNARITSKEINQLRKYLKNLNCETGILVNFYETLEIYIVTQATSRKV